MRMISFKCGFLGLAIMFSSFLAAPVSAAPGNCTKGLSYFHNEATNSQGANKCTTDCDCDGNRTCSSGGWCQGTSGHASANCTKSGNYYYNEGPTQNRCGTNCDCDGMRTCSSAGYCQGNSAHPGTQSNPASGAVSATSCTKSANYYFNEGPTKNQCTNNCQCDGNRTCSPWGYCSGTSR